MRIPRTFYYIITLALVAVAVSQAHAYEELHYEWRLPTPEQNKAREEAQRQREEAARREQQQIDSELARRGWPKSREGEVRKFMELQKKAASLAPKPGAGSMLHDVQDEWARRREEASKAGSAPIETSVASTAKAETVKPSPITPSGPKSNCQEVDAYSKVAVGWSRVSEEDARGIAQAKTKGCNIVAEMSCTSSRNARIEDGKIKAGDTWWDCRASYHCGEKRLVCEHTGPKAASKQ